MKVKDNLVRVIKVGDIDYISLTDLARYKNPLNPGDVIIKWMSNKSSFDFYCLWEELSNYNFKLAESREFKIDSATQSFTMSPSRWIKETNAIGFISKRGKYGGGTFAHPDIALEFASWIDSAFKLYQIKEFERLKAEEQKQLGWSAKRELSKINYRIHTDAIKHNLIPVELTKEQINYIYAEEADVLNMALFGMTAKQWRNENPNLDGNIRDYATINELICLANLENLNSVFINDGLKQSERLIKLNQIAISQMQILNDNDVKYLKQILEA